MSVTEIQLLPACVKYLFLKLCHTKKFRTVEAVLYHGAYFAKQAHLEQLKVYFKEISIFKRSLFSLGKKIIIYRLMNFVTCKLEKEDSMYHFKYHLVLVHHLLTGQSSCLLRTPGRMRQETAASC